LSTSIWASLNRAERATIVDRPTSCKLAHEAVAILQLELIGSGARVGELIGTLPEIRQRYGLGRWACREAVSILEMRGWVESRRGVGGGLIVTLPSVRDLTKLMLVYLCLKGAHTDQILEVRRLVHRAVVGTLMRRGNERSELQKLRLDRPSSSASDFSGWLAAQTGNRALELVMNFVTGLHQECSDANVAVAAAADLQHLWSAICDNDVDQAVVALEHFLASTSPARRGERIALPGDFLRDGSGRASSGAARLARLLIGEIAAHDGPGLIRLGTEADIGTRHHCHHEVVRQAVRLLEDIGILAPRRGGNGGLICRAPDLAAVIELIPPLLHRQHVLPREVMEAMTLLKREAAFLAAWRMRTGLASENVRQLAGQLLGARPTQPHELIAVENCLIDLAENSVLSAFDRGLVLYGPIASPEIADHAALATATFSHMPGILRAILDGEPELAEAATLNKLCFLLPSHAEKLRSVRSLGGHC
jgi:DNA-binding FadR family transcriptional regulator